MDERLAETIGVEAYTFLYPLVLMDTTRRQMTNVERVGEAPGRGPADVFVNIPAFPAADFRGVVRPNFDSLHWIAWLDLHRERVASLPAASDNYYLLPLGDMWGEIFACPGTRTNGGDAVDVAIVGPGWSGDLPAGVRRYDAPSAWVWIIGRTEASVATYDRVPAFQAGLKITPLSAWGSESPAVIGTVDPSVDGTTAPLGQVFGMDAATLFGSASELLREQAPHFQDYPTLDRLVRIGLHAGQRFDLGSADPVVWAALAKAVPAAQKKITDRQQHIGGIVNGWRLVTHSMGNNGTDYLQRDCIELVGLGANLSEDAFDPLLYVDADGEPFAGTGRYVWHLAQEQLPPVNAFGSFTFYDAEGFQVANELDRFAIGDLDSLRFNDDGSLDILNQHEKPKEGASNWPTAPEGGFNLCARPYHPKPEALDGTWSPPAVTRV